MPEGPSLVILKEEVQSYKGKKVITVSGNTKIKKEDGHSRYYWIDKKGHRHYVKEAELKARVRKED